MNPRAYRLCALPSGAAMPLQRTTARQTDQLRPHQQQGAAAAAAAAGAAAPQQPHRQPVHRRRRYHCPVALPEDTRRTAGDASALAKLEYDPTTGEQRAAQLQGLHTGAVQELTAASYLHTLGSFASPPGAVPSFDGDDLVLSPAPGAPVGGSAVEWLLPARAAPGAPALPAAVGPAVPTVVSGESMQLHPARRLLLAVVRSLAFCHEHDLASREAKPTALLSYGKGTQPWDTELDELFECRKGRTPFADGTAFDDVWIDYIPPEILLGAEVAVTPRGGGTRPPPENVDVAAADMWVVGCWFAEILRGGKSAAEPALPCLDLCARMTG